MEIEPEVGSGMVWDAQVDEHLLRGCEGFSGRLVYPGRLRLRRPGRRGSRSGAGEDADEQQE